MSATLVSNCGWFPASWRGHPARQMPAYADERRGCARSKRGWQVRAPVIAIEDAARLREAMAELAEGRGFLLQGGDCAESFDDPVAEQVAGIVGLFDAMAERLRPAVDGPLVEVARIAGQFAKPRSAQTKRMSGVTLPAYRGDIVNGIAFDAARARGRSAADDPGAYAVGRHGGQPRPPRGVAGAPIFTSHEALLLPYEEPLTRRDPAGRWWATSGHMLWLGDRTRQLDGAHVEFLRGIENVVGVKCGPGADARRTCFGWSTGSIRLTVPASWC